MTERENLLKVYNGETPEWVPVSEKATCGSVVSELVKWCFLPNMYRGQVITDIFGISYTVADPRICPLPTPGVFKIPDITRWEECLENSFPDLDAMDWEAMAKKDTAHFDRENKVCKVAVGGNICGAPFEMAMDMLGHRQGLMAMIEEEDAWHGLMNAITEWHEKLVDKVVTYYKPDCIQLGDDVCNAKGPFMSPSMYRDMIKPYHARIIKRIREGGCYAELHCCGKGEALVDDWKEIGIQVWNPVQIVNDLPALKAKYGNSFVFCGAWDSHGPAGMPGASEETVRSAVRRSMDILAPGGGYVFSTCGMTEAWSVGDEHISWIYDEAEKYGHTFYK